MAKNANANAKAGARGATGRPGVRARAAAGAAKGGAKPGKAAPSAKNGKLAPKLAPKKAGAKGAKAADARPGEAASDGRKGTGKPAARAKPEAGAKAAAGAKPAAGKASKAAKAAAAKPAGSFRPSAADKAVSRAAINAARGAKSPQPAPEPLKAPPKKSPYNRKSLAPLRTALLTLRKRLAGDMDLMSREALRADEPEVDAENVADHGSDAFERTMTLELMENEARTMRQIDEALDMMDTGRYGLCQECGQAIPVARLEALPFAQTCVPCKEALERQR